MGIWIDPFNASVAAKRLLQHYDGLLYCEVYEKAMDLIERSKKPRWCKLIKQRTLTYAEAFAWANSDGLGLPIIGGMKYGRVMDELRRFIKQCNLAQIYGGRVYVTSDMAARLEPHWPKLNTAERWRRLSTT